METPSRYGSSHDDLPEMNMDGNRVTLRSDLMVAARWDRGHRWWLIHDPVRNAFHRVADVDWQELVRGRADWRLHAEANSQGLLNGSMTHASTGSWSDPSLARRAGVGLGSWWTVRLPGLPMDRLAERLVRWSGWCMSLPAIGVWCATMLVAILTIAVYWESFCQRLPLANEMMGTSNLFTLMVLTFVTKLVHELGHAVACKRQGARVGEMGILLIAGAPCMFCDVTAAWGLPGRLQRAAVMAAGMYVEWILATLATVVWVVIPTGTLSLICLDLILICSLSTLVFNGNPLMRFDGYFIVSDLVNSANLQQSAANCWRSIILSVFRQYHFHLSDIPLAIYHILASIYRTVVTMMMAWWIARTLYGMHLFPIAVATGLILCAISALPWGIGLRNWLRGRDAWQNIPSAQRWLAFGTLCVLLVTVLCHTSPLRMPAQGLVEVADARTIFVPTMGGIIVRVHATVGDVVEEEEILVELENPELELAQLEQQRKCDRLKVQYQTLQARSLAEPELLERCQTLREGLTAAERQAELLADRLAQLTVRAPCSGTVLPPRDSATFPATEQVGSVVLEGSDWCRVGNPQSLQVEMIVDRIHRRHFGVGATAKLMAEYQQTKAVPCRVAQVDEEPESGPESKGKLRVRCLVPAQVGWPPGVQVQGWIEGPALPLYSRLAQWVYRWTVT